MTTVRIAHAEPRPGKLANGGFHTRGYLVVLADDAGHRAVPIWMQDAGDLADLMDRPADRAITDGVPAELAIRLLGAARARVTGVDIDVTQAGAAELSPQVTVARISLAGAPGALGQAGTRQVTADLGLGLAVAAAAGAPLRLADAVLDRLAVPVPGDDLLTPFLHRVPPAARPGYRPPRWPLAATPGRRPRYEPRNLDFADGLDRWDLDAWSSPEPERPERPERPDAPDYAATADGPSAVVSATVARPAGSAALVQAIYADDYRGTTVTFSGQVRADPLTGQAGLRLEILRHRWTSTGAREDHGLTIVGPCPAWTRYEITAPIAADADLIRFGVALTGPGRIALRNPDLRAAEPDARTPRTP